MQISMMLGLYHRHLNGTDAMIRHVMVGASDIERSRRLHGAVPGTGVLENDLGGEHHPS